MICERITKIIRKKGLKKLVGKPFVIFVEDFVKLEEGRKLKIE